MLVTFFFFWLRIFEEIKEKLTGSFPLHRMVSPKKCGLALN